MVSAIILAGGRGKRMGQNISKQYILINEKPVLYYTIKRFLECESIDNIVLVLPKDEIDYCKSEVLDKYSLKVDKIVEGGAERQDSVYNGLKSLDNTDIVLIHDGARPFVSKRVIEEAQCGFCCEAENPIALAECCRQMAALSIEEREAFGLRAKKYCKDNYSRDRFFNTLEKELNALKGIKHGS